MTENQAHSEMTTMVRSKKAPESYCRHGEADYLSCEKCQALMTLGSFPMVGFLVEPGAYAKWEHDLKIAPESFREVKAGRKTFEIRLNDRDFRADDVLHLKEWDGQRFTGETVYKLVPYVSDFEQKPGVVVMSLAQLLVIQARRS